MSNAWLVGRHLPGGCVHAREMHTGCFQPCHPCTPGSLCSRLLLNKRLYVVNLRAAQKGRGATELQEWKHTTALSIPQHLPHFQANICSILNKR